MNAGYLNLNWISVILTFTAIITVFLGLIVNKKESVPGSGYLFGLFMSTSLWSISNAIEYLVAEPSLKIILTKISYLGIATAPVFLLYFTVYFSGLNTKYDVKKIKYIWIVSILMILSGFTNEFHYYTWREYQLVPSVVGKAILYKTGPIVWLFAAFVYSIFFICSYLLVKFAQKKHSIYKKQMSIFIVSFIYPLIFNILYLSRATPVPELDLTPLAFSLTAITLFIAIVQIGLFEIVPHSRESLFLSLPDSVFVLDANLNIIDFNPAAEKYFNTKNITGENVLSVFPNVLGHNFEDDGFNQKIEYKIENAGIETWFDIVVSDVVVSNPKEHGFLLVFRDVTARKVWEKQIRESEIKLAELNANKDKFFSIIAHDLKNPLSSLKITTEMLSGSFDILSREDKREFVDLLKISTESVYALLENLLSWSRSQRGLIPFNPEPLNLKYIASNVVNLFYPSIEKKSIKLENKIDKSLYVMADINMLDTIFRNLLSNAIKYSPNEGNIKISADKSDSEGFITIIVEDDGIGISEQDKAKLFRIDVHHTSIGNSGEKGTGLGLILVKEFVNYHKGEISVESELGKGSKFIFTIPAISSHLNLEDINSGSDLIG